MATPKALLTGHAAIDAEHGAILTQIAQLRGLSGARVWAVVGYLKQLFRTHFAREELLMFEMGYPGLERHALVHQEPLNELDARARGPAPRRGADRRQRGCARRDRRALGGHAHVRARPADGGVHPRGSERARGRFRGRDASSPQTRPSRGKSRRRRPGEAHFERR